MALVQELTSLDATAQAELVRKGEVTPQELLDAAIERTERLNPAINCVVTPLFDEARAAIKAGLPDGPLRGVPYMLKDLFAAYAGTRMTFGSNLCENFISPHDSELVARLKRAGLVIMGKTSTPEFGILPTTEPHRFGPCRNPWNTNHSVGGSSGGSAAAVACGMVPAAHGNDGGGSIRIPASCCGLFGLKPTRGRNPLGPDVGDVQNGLVSEHALTHTVRDSAALLDATAGPELGDPYYAPPQERPYTEEIKREPGALRIAFTTSAPTGAPVHDDCVAAIHDTAKLCESLGHHVEEAFPAIDGPSLFQPFATVFSAGPAWAMDGLAMMAGVTPSRDKVEPLSWAMYQQMQQVSCTQYLLSITYLQQVSRQIAQFMKDYDLLLTPTVAQPPLPIGSYDSPDDPMYGFMVAGMFAPFTPLCNFTGQPAMNVPLHWNSEGLPIGSHFIGRFGDESTLFRLAAQLETTRPWITRQPRIFG